MNLDPTRSAVRRPCPWRPDRRPDSRAPRAPRRGSPRETIRPTHRLPAPRRGFQPAPRARANRTRGLRRLRPTAHRLHPTPTPARPFAPRSIQGRLHRQPRRRVRFHPSRSARSTPAAFPARCWKRLACRRRQTRAARDLNSPTRPFPVRRCRRQHRRRPPRSGRSYPRRIAPNRRCQPHLRIRHRHGPNRPSRLKRLLPTRPKPRSTRSRRLRLPVVRAHRSRHPIPSRPRPSSIPIQTTHPPLSPSPARARSTKA